MQNNGKVHANMQNLIEVPKNMTLSLPSHAILATILVAIFFSSEFFVFLYKRSDINTKSKDQGSLRMLGLVIFCSFVLARLFRVTFPQAQLDILLQLAAVGVGIFSVGIAVRWYSIIYLGRFFTVDVAIAADHKVIDSGPYRHVRHPSYTGLLMIWLGIGICSGNILTLLAMTLPPAIALLHRIGIEEAALSDALGSHYINYVGKTKRLIPFVY
jgi:protein-S-isoprenylcysteine O-methyltransferase